MTVFHCSSVMSAKAASCWRPALATRMSSRPYALSTASNSRLTSSSSETSACSASASPPASRIVSTTASAASSELR